MHRFAMKALFAVLSLNRAERTRIDWDRTVIAASTAVTLGLVTFYIFGKWTGRW
ncbi:hypothetical protein JQ617_03970 [Bradyrhizobium sp. KB893862 SZCCT0404]|uniref:hypothetical protein n=1 Tax=Bradyrhizobium sp. KB893862 SZCCT0404 TaxID=2807672 RepID=UPI001BA64D93|nr:hypothetical protein [Bradyrhizobium sp. KB893862 SZCCT0404]MBR1173101.1 hypothetical protein [Bradyrhizobium sp. KB893862 SZCCT0404]